jgi:transcriptional regulator with XRE-family HTH domain
MAPRSPAEVALGKAVRTLREERKMSQEAFALAFEVHRTYIGKIERGEANITLMVLRRLADAFGLRPSELLARAERLER